MTQDVFAVFVREKWYIATVCPSSEYGLLDENLSCCDVWSEAGTTALLCKVGEETKAINLDEAEATP